VGVSVGRRVSVAVGELVALAGIWVGVEVRLGSSVAVKVGVLEAVAEGCMVSVIVAEGLGVADNVGVADKLGVRLGVPGGKVADGEEV
jgi:hypothetical protein